ncbi:hypothetical protein ACROYT_G024019 [Oculina patagonica]
MRIFFYLSPKPRTPPLGSHSKLDSLEDEWQINETYMDNISKYPKDWYRQMTHKKKPKEEETSERAKSNKRRSSNQSDKSGKEAKDKQESSENGDGTGAGSKTDEDKDAIAE